MMGYGQGALIVGLSGMPTVLEAACRARVVTPNEMKEFRVSWAGVRALIAIDPQMLPQGSELVKLQRALPELLRIQPTGIYREVMVSRKCIQKEFVRQFGDLIAAPPERERLRTGALRVALSLSTPLYFEDDEAGMGLCCVCGKKGALGRCPKCGILMHYSCVSPRLPGGPLPCPRCARESEGVEEGPAWPHEMEVGAPGPRRLKQKGARPEAEGGGSLEGHGEDSCTNSAPANSVLDASRLCNLEAYRRFGDEECPQRF